MKKRLAIQRIAIHHNITVTRLKCVIEWCCRTHLECGDTTAPRMWSDITASPVAKHKTPHLRGRGWGCAMFRDQEL